MAKKRDVSRYHFKDGNKILHRGITKDLDRREQEHQQKWPEGHIEKIGPKVTRESGLQWERKGGKKI